MTGDEVALIVRHWTFELLDMSWELFVYGSTGGRSYSYYRNRAYRRLDALETALGRDIFDNVFADAVKAYGRSVDPRMWDAFLREDDALRESLMKEDLGAGANPRFFVVPQSELRPVSELIDLLKVKPNALRYAPALRMLTTSREPLGVPGESVWRIPSLSVPDASVAPAAEQLREFEATQLFIDRATSIDAAFIASAENAERVARICRQLDGIPLAIELAAARMGALSVEQIEARLNDRFRLLTGGARTAAPRQRTLEATVQWSYQLLSDVECEVLNRLSVFPAGWTLEAAEIVCGRDGIDRADIVDIVSRLVNKSLVGREGQPVSGQRYGLLDTVRQYARDRLTEAGALVRLRDRHLDWIHEEFRDALPILQSRGQTDCLRRLRVERHNVRAALEWALSSPSRAPKGLELAGALFWFWTKSGEFAEGREWLDRALAVKGLDDRSSRARALIGLARILLFQGHIAEVAAAATEALALGRETGDAWTISWALYWLAIVAIERGDRAQAAALTIEARDASHGEDSVAGPLGLLSVFAWSKGEPDRAQQLCDEANNIMRRAGEIWVSLLKTQSAVLPIAVRRSTAARRHSVSSRTPPRLRLKAVKEDAGRCLQLLARKQHVLASTRHSLVYFPVKK